MLANEKYSEKHHLTYEKDKKANLLLFFAFQIAFRGFWQG
jgi:hypothetical protein